MDAMVPTEPSDLEEARRIGERIGLRLHCHRIVSSIKAGDLAEHLGISRAALYRYEKGDVVKLETAVQVARLLGITFDQVIGPLGEVERAAIVEAMVPAELRQRLRRLQAAS